MITPLRAVEEELMSFVGELKRRNVVRVGIAYVVIGWVLAQIAEFAFDNFGAPEWVLKSFVVLLLLGLPIVLFFAWAFEMTPEGIKREKDVDRSHSITSHTGRKIDFLIIAVLVIAVGVLAFDKLVGDVDGTTATSLEQSVAVLPFVNMSDDADHFADGLTEELLNLLAKNRDLKVAGRTSSFAFKGRNDDLRGIGKALGVAKVLEGSVRRSGERLRVTAQLINVEDGFHLWSETYDRDMADIFDIQDEVAAAITQAMELHLTPATERLTDNADAYAAYLQAIALQSLEEREDIFTAIAALDRAVALDPEFAKAYELRAFFHWMSAGWVVPSAVGQRQVFDAASEALRLDPSLASARSLRDTSDVSNWTWTIEIGALEELVKSDRSVRALDSYAYDLAVTGYFAEAESILREIVARDPLSGNAVWRLGDALSMQGRYSEALKLWRKSVEFGAVEPMYRLAVHHLIIGEDDTAATYLDEQGALSASDFSGARAFIHSMRDSSTGEQALDQWIAKEVERGENPVEINVTYGYYLAFGYLDKFVASLNERSQPGPEWQDGEDMETTGLVHAGSRFIQHPGYVERAKASGLADLWDSRGAPDRCSKAGGEWVCN